MLPFLRKVRTHIHIFCDNYRYPFKVWAKVLKNVWWFTGIFIKYNILTTWSVAQVGSFDEKTRGLVELSHLLQIHFSEYPRLCAPPWQWSHSPPAAPLSLRTIQTRTSEKDKSRADTQPIILVVRATFLQPGSKAPKKGNSNFLSNPFNIRENPR